MPQSQLRSIAKVVKRVNWICATRPGNKPRITESETESPGKSLGLGTNPG